MRIRKFLDRQIGYACVNVQMIEIDRYWLAIKDLALNGIKVCQTNARVPHNKWKEMVRHTDRFPRGLLNHVLNCEQMSWKSNLYYSGALESKREM